MAGRLVTLPLVPLVAATCSNADAGDAGGPTSVDDSELAAGIAVPGRFADRAGPTLADILGDLIPEPTA